MTDPAPAAVCPNGHASADRTFCSVCGTWISGAVLYARDGGPVSASTPTLAPNHTAMPPTSSSPSLASAPAGGGSGQVPQAGGGECPNCSSELDAGTRFCEVCGYDPATGSLPSAPVVQPVLLPPVASPSSATVGPALPHPASVRPAPAPLGAPTPSRLLAVVTADRAYYDSQQVREVQFPVGAPSRVIELPAGPATIGRRSRSRGTDPAVDLAVPPEDPAVSHTHASLLPGDGGTWALVDHGSTNGTYLNETPEPLPANIPRTVRPGDRIYVGAWTRITLELRPSP